MKHYMVMILTLGMLLISGCQSSPTAGIYCLICVDANMPEPEPVTPEEIIE